MSHKRQGLLVIVKFIYLPPNGVAHLQPSLARRLIHNSTKFRKVPQHTHAEGGQRAAGVRRRFLN